MYCGPSEQIALLQALDTKQQSHMKHGKCFAVHDCWRNCLQFQESKKGYTIEFSHQIGVILLALSA
jgi:hypothetical protein